MIVDATKDNIGRKNRPATMAAFAVGTNVYFSSALKGGGSFLLEIGEPRDPTTPSPITDDAAGVLGQAILRCQNQYGTDHINDVKCAEPLAIQAYLVNNQDSKPFPELETSISTYGGKSGRNLQIMDPCQVRCATFLWCFEVADNCHTERSAFQRGRLGLYRALARTWHLRSG